MKILCVICARKGSKGIKNKNLLNFFGKTLIKHTLDQAKSISKITDIVVSTDSKKIQKETGTKFSWFLRSKKLSGDNVPKINVIVDALKKSEKNFKYKYDIIIDLDVTSPLRAKKDIINSVDIFIKKKYKNLFSVCKSSKNPYFNMVENKNGKVKLCKENKNIFSRQLAPKVFDMNAAIYIWRRDALLKENKLFTSNTGLYVMPKNRSIDIDDNLDYKIAKFLYEKKKR